jgi:hypothetical protein
MFFKFGRPVEVLKPETLFRTNNSCNIRRGHGNYHETKYLRPFYMDHSSLESKLKTADIEGSVPFQFWSNVFSENFTCNLR